MEVCTVGGFEYVGNNMTAVKTGEDVFIFDAGVNIPSLIEMQGDEIVHKYNESKLRKYGAIPNDLVLDELGWTKKVRAIFISHAHLDHVGAVPWIAHRYPNATIYGTAFTISLLRNIIRNEKLFIRNKIKVVQEDTSQSIRGKSGNYKINFIHATHSTIQCSFLALETPEGIFLYALDFKMDDTPVMGKPPSYNKLRKIGRKGVKALVVNSLYSHAKGRTESENIARQKVKKALHSVAAQKKNALFVSTFSSHIVRLHSIIEYGRKTKRQVVILGRSMAKYINCAKTAKQWKIPDRTIIAKYARHANSMLKKINANRGKYLVICTGHQAEPDSILDRITNEKTPFIFKQGDNLVFSSKVIPVEENLEARKQMDSTLKKKGVKIQDNVHVSGHGSSEDIKMLINLTKPQNIVPTHGTPAQEKPAIDIAEKLGYTHGKNVQLSQDGKVLKF